MKDIILHHCNESEWTWINHQISKNPLLGFVATPRHVSKNRQVDASIPIDNTDYLIQTQGWTLDRLVRIYFLFHLNSDDGVKYRQSIQQLFETAEINEAVAIVSGLALLPYAQELKFYGTEAVRSNIGQVFDAFAFNNPYAAMYFSEAEWNQLILKTIFNQKPIHLITGLKERNNETLAISISDFAHERWAAGRTVPAQVWRLVTDFLNSQIWEDIRFLANSNSVSDQKAAYLVCQQSQDKKATDFLQNHTKFQSFKNTLVHWEQLEQL
ncbi:hypothetical protein GCM10025777_28730 [Membranihabitans marinus]